LRGPGLYCINYQPRALPMKPLLLVMMPMDVEDYSTLMTGMVTYRWWRWLFLAV